MSDENFFTRELKFPCLIIDTSNPFCIFGLVTESSGIKSEFSESRVIRINDREYSLMTSAKRESYSFQTGMAEVIDSDLKEFLENANIKISEVKSLVCSVGPGSFTGLRTGLAFSRGLKFSLGVPLHFCSNLLAALMFSTAQTKNGLWKAVLAANKDENFVSTMELLNGYPFSLSEIEVEPIGEELAFNQVKLVRILELKDFEIIEGYLRAVLLNDQNISNSAEIMSVVVPQLKSYENDSDLVEPFYIKGVSALTLVERGVKSPLDQIASLK